MSQFVVVFIQIFFTALWLVIVGRVLLSWVNPTFSGPVARFLFDTTEPLLKPIRRFLPATGAVDLSPLVLMLILTLVLNLVVFR